MKTKPSLPSFSLMVGAFAFLFLSWSVLSWNVLPSRALAGEKSTKEFSALKVLQAAAKNLSKSKGYRVSIHVDGGLTDREDHKVNGQRVANDDYQGEVYGSTMYVPEPKAYRQPGKGAAYVDGLWRDIQSDMRTKRLEKFFPFPERVLNLALQNPQTARWLKPGEAAKDDTKSEEPEESSKAEPALEKAPSGKGKAGAPAAEKKPEAPVNPGKTVLAPTPKSEAEIAKATMPRFMRVDATPKEALTVFTDVQNSGCMGGGWGVSKFISSLDKTVTNAYYEIEIDPETQVPVSIYMVVLTGSKGGTETKGKQITGGKHVAFHFNYDLTDFGKVEKPQIPLPAQKLLARSW